MAERGDKAEQVLRLSTIQDGEIKLKVNAYIIHFSK